MLHRHESSTDDDEEVEQASVPGGSIGASASVADAIEEFEVPVLSLGEEEDFEEDVQLFWLVCAHVMWDIRRKDCLDFFTPSQSVWYLEDLELVPITKYIIARMKNVCHIIFDDFKVDNHMKMMSWSYCSEYWYGNSDHIECETFYRLEYY